MHNGKLHVTAIRTAAISIVQSSKNEFCFTPQANRIQQIICMEKRGQSTLIRKNFRVCHSLITHITKYAIHEEIAAMSNPHNGIQTVLMTVLVNAPAKEVHRIPVVLFVPRYPVPIKPDNPKKTTPIYKKGTYKYADEYCSPTNVKIKYSVMGIARSTTVQMRLE